MYTRLVRLICTLLALTMLCLGTGAVAEEQATTAYVAVLELEIYDAPAQGAGLVSVMSYGEVLWVLAAKGEIAQVRTASGDVGYCLSGGLSASNPNNLDEEAYVKAGGATVYLRPDEGCDTRVSLEAGTKLHVVAITPDFAWARVEQLDSHGYVATNELSAEPASHQVWIVSDGAVAVFHHSGFEDQYGTCSHGQSFELLGTLGGMAQIRNAQGAVGWVAKEVISDTDPNILNQSAYVLADGRLLWPNAMLSGTAQTLAKDEKLTVVSMTIGGMWCRVRVGESYGYVLSVLLDSHHPGSEATLIVSPVDDQLVYAEAQAGAEVLTTVGAGESVMLLGVSESGQGLKIRTRGMVEGYVTAGGWVRE